MADRQLSPREQRDVRDRSGGRSRDRGRGRGSYLTYYDDLGFSTTDEGYEQWQENESAYNEKKATIMGQIQSDQAKIDAAYGDYDKAKNQIPGFDDALNEAYSKATSGWVNVRVVDASDNIEGVYKLPKEYAQSFAGNGSLFTSWHGNNLNVSTKARGGSTVGGELHESLGTAVQQARATFDTEMSGQIASQLGAANASLAGSKGQLDTAAANLQGNKEQIAAIDTERNRQKGEMRTNYDKRISNLKDVIGGFQVDRKSNYPGPGA